MAGVLALVERGDETAFLQHGADGGENSEHAHHAVVGLGEQTGQENAEHKVEQLLDAVAHPAPKEAACCFLFQ